MDSFESPFFNTLPRLAHVNKPSKTNQKVPKGNIQNESLSILPMMIQWHCKLRYERK